LVSDSFTISNPFSQMYQNQFQKYDPQPFQEADVDRMVVSDDGPIMAKWTVRAAFQRSIAKLFYHAGFEETQPQALDAVTDLASDFFSNIARTFSIYTQAPKVREDQVVGSFDIPQWTSRFTSEEALLHSLDENGVELEALEGYAKEDIDRLGSKLDALHDRYKMHLAELLVSKTACEIMPCQLLTISSFSDLPSVQMPVQMDLVHLLTTVSNSSVATLPRTSERTSLDSRNSGLIKNLVSRRSAFRSISYRIGCTMHTLHKTQSMSTPP
jgi:hypothetical protein